MTTQTVALKVEELRRRVSALPRELAQWLVRVRAPGELKDLDAHVSQLNAISIIIGAATSRQSKLLDQAPKTEATLGPWAQQLADEVVKAQRVWGYFRDKLELRFSPNYKESLWLADTIAFDCHRAAQDAAVLAGMAHQEELRPPPLTYLDAELSHATWVRGARPDDGRDYLLGDSRLPIPLVSLPWDSTTNIWEQVAIAHEVAHDIEADLALRPTLRKTLGDALTNAKIPAERISRWLDWQGEVLADLLAIQLMGPAFLDGLVHLLLRSPGSVHSSGNDDPHPTPFFRILICAAHARTLGIQKVDQKPRAELVAHVERIVTTWQTIYGAQAAASTADWLDDAPHVIAAIVDSPIPVKDRPAVTLRELLPYTEDEDRKIRGAANYLASGSNKPMPLRVRHVVAAARIAANDVAASPADLSQSLSAVNDRAAALIREVAPKGPRGPGVTDRHKRFLESFLT